MDELQHNPGPRPAHEPIPPNYEPLVEACARFQINRQMAYRLAADGLIETFPIGRRLYVTIDSLNKLPDRLRAQQQRRG